MTHPGGNPPGLNAQGTGGFFQTMGLPPGHQNVQIANNQTVGSALLGRGQAPKAATLAGDIVARGMARVFEMAELYSISHLAGEPQPGHGPEHKPGWADICSRPNPLHPQHRRDPPWVKDQIRRQAPPNLGHPANQDSAAAIMLGQYEPRVFLATRVLIYFLTRVVLAEDCFNPLAANNPQANLPQDPQSVRARALAQSIQYAHRNIVFTAATPNQHQLRNSIANHLRQMREVPVPNNQRQTLNVDQMCAQRWFATTNTPDPGSPKGIANKRGDEFWPVAIAFMHGKIACDWSDLLEIMQKAHYLVFEMYSQPWMYQFQWLDHLATFDPDIMVARQHTGDRFQNQNGYGGERCRGRTIRFIISPIVRKRSVLPNGTITKPTTICKAQVVLADLPVVGQNQGSAPDQGGAANQGLFHRDRRRN